MAAVSKGAVASSKKGKAAAPKLADLIADKGDGGVAFVSRKGVDGAFIIPPGPKHHRETGVRIGYDEGVHLDFRGVGVTGPYYPAKNKRDREIIERIEEAIKDGLPIVEEIGLEVLTPDAPVPPFAKWDTTSAAAIKVALSVQFDEDDHDANVEIVKQAARYEKANQDREDVLAVLQGLLATEAAESDAFDVEVSVS